MSWKAGDLVDVYDPDDRQWLPGVVEEVAHIKGHRFTIVQTDNAEHQGLQLKIAVPPSRAAWIRKRGTDPSRSN